MTQAQLDAEIEKELAAADAAIKAGATVKGAGGSAVGTIEAVADGNGHDRLQDGKKMKLPRAGVRGNADGTVTIGYTAEQLAGAESTRLPGGGAGRGSFAASKLG